MAMFKQAYSVPHVSILPFTLAEGKEIIVGGVLAPHANGFLISLSVGRNHNSESPFVFNPRFTEGQVIRNHNSNGWGAEERHGSFPFKKGAPFEVKIVVRHHAFQVFVNNVHHSDFNHRLAKESARHLYIEGEVSVDRVSFVDAIHNPQVPVTIPIHGGLNPGRVIVVSGIPNGSDRFNVNLVCGSSIDHHDVALTFDARFSFGSNNKQVVRNSKTNGRWGSEELRQNYFPFSANAPFQITISVEHRAFRVSVNNQHFVDFNHRIKQLHHITHLHIEGAVRITEIRV